MFLVQCPEIMAGAGTAPEVKPVTSLCRKRPWEPTPKSPSQPCSVATHHPTGQPGELPVGGMVLEGFEQGDRV